MQMSSLIDFPKDAWRAVRRFWPLFLVLALAGAWVWFAFVLSDAQGRLDLPRGYSIRMTCEDDPEADLWRGGCERLEADIAAAGRPSFFELFRAFVAVHHAPTPREAAAASAAQPEPGFDLDRALAGQRYGLAIERHEFEGVQSGVHADAVKAAIDERDRALLVIERAGLSMPPLIAGAAANLVHPGTMMRGAVKYVDVLRGRAKHSDLVTGGSGRR
ncbi:hypothetical protein [Hyphomicrobium sp.]|uniref:hypothetical protein n=1 Tax=Hyphomicrobium sp. TaxID=82 RepID=UPI002C174921|nr:hypothetical protein [Hyphomicrobium sp.]HRN88352.1 hypothetical protein [Hyphomicrobium sp.]HRQ28145.1 hypothetical protein [Hyphomicrobium sp.]